MMARALIAIGFAAMCGLTPAQAQESGWLSSGWQVEAASQTWSDQSANRDSAATNLNLEIAWPAGASVASRGPESQRFLDSRVRIVSCYEAAQAWASDDIYGGTFGRIEGARGLGSVVDSQYARDRRWAQFGACSNTSH
jgi:hypothetical protein